LRSDQNSKLLIKKKLCTLSIFFFSEEKSVRNDLHWEADMQMTSHYIDRKVRFVESWPYFAAHCKAGHYIYAKTKFGTSIIKG